jgi:hypothetical protein
MTCISQVRNSIRVLLQFVSFLMIEMMRISLNDILPMVSFFSHISGGRQRFIRPVDPLYGLDSPKLSVNYTIDYDFMLRKSKQFNLKRFKLNHKPNELNCDSF